MTTYKDLMILDVNWLDRNITSFKEDMAELHKNRNEAKEKYGGISEEENKDFFFDLNHLQSQIVALEAVKSQLIPAKDVLEKAWFEGRELNIKHFEQFLNQEVKT